MKNRELAYYVAGLQAGSRVVLGQAITLVESQKQEDRSLANELIEAILPQTGHSIRLGITGAPGVGKSTFIEALGNYLTEKNQRVAVLAIDPSSSKSKGSILGDKTRMETLSKNPQAFIRPTSAGDILGGVANNTRETILLCEAAGFNVIFVETVGVGQSEVTVRNMVDFFLLLMLAGAGDELQGIKKGIMEMADAIAITKADDENVAQATRAKNEYQQALHLFETTQSGWIPKVVMCSALTNKGIAEVWEIIENYRDTAYSNGYFMWNREEQNLTWFRAHLNWHLENTILKSIISNQEIHELEVGIRKKSISPIRASQQLIQNIRNKITSLS